MPEALIRALLVIKRAAARVNASLGALPQQKADAIVAAADEALAGKHTAEFPLAIWQTGSGTQTNMNVNEVLANRASELMGGRRGEERLVHPNDDVNRGQSSNDVFPTAMCVAAAETVTRDLLPALDSLRGTLAGKAAAFKDIVKIGRTHLQDATPLTLGQEFSGYVAQLEHARAHIEAALPHLTSSRRAERRSGTGSTRTRNSVRAWRPRSPRHGLPFVTAPNKFEALAANDALVICTARCKRWPRRSRRSPTTSAGSRADRARTRRDHDPRERAGQLDHAGQGQSRRSARRSRCLRAGDGQRRRRRHRRRSRQLRAQCLRPMVIHNVLQSVRLLADGMASFDAHCARGSNRM
jgi:fumarate hydratase class II